MLPVDIVGTMRYESMNLLTIAYLADLYLKCNEVRVHKPYDTFLSNTLDSVRCSECSCFVPFDIQVTQNN